VKPYRELWWPKFRPFLWITDDLPDTKRGRRKASNCGLWIRIRRDVYDNEPWVFQQEVFESRYWMRHPWRLIDFYWFYKGPQQQVLIRPVTTLADMVLLYRIRKRERAAEHLCRVECMSRAQEIRARLDAIGPDMANSVAARSYARSITTARNYPFFAAAAWDEERAYKEIMRWL
jgi:hypothetical protein